MSNYRDVTPTKRTVLKMRGKEVLVATAPTQVNNRSRVAYLCGPNKLVVTPSCECCGVVVDGGYMKLLLSLVVCIGLFGGVASGQDQQPSLQPTPLEAFAGLPATHVAWSKEVGRLDSREAQAVITALVLEDTAQPPDRMRGVRIELSSRDSRDEIFLGEETLSIYKRALDEITTEATRQRNQLFESAGILVRG